MDRDISIIAQNSGNTAAVLYAGLTASGVVTGWDESLFTEIRKAVFNGTLALAGAEAVVTGITDTPKSERQPATVGASSEPGEIDFRTGKHRGKTIAQVYDTDPDYLEWASGNLKNDYMRTKITDFLAGV